MAKSFLERIRDRPPSPPPQRTRYLVAALVGLLSAAFAGLKYLQMPWHPPDFVQAWFAARALLAGGNPYALVGPGLQFDWPWGLFYPATAMVAAIPFTILPSFAATLLFTALSGAALAYAVTDMGWHRLWIFFSAPYLIASGASQWSPLFAAAMLLPPLAFLFAAKPNLGLALFVASGSTRVRVYALAGVLILGIASLVLFPAWPMEWWRAIRGAEHMGAPIARLGGPLILLALLRWRRWEARLIVALACVPQTTYWYEAVPLLLIPATYREAQIYALVVSLGFVLQPHIVSAQNEVDFNRQVGAMMVALAYLPAVFLVLRRPNEGGIAPIHAAAAGPLQAVVAAVRRRRATGDGPVT